MKASFVFKVIIAGSLFAGLAMWVHLKYGWLETIAAWAKVPLYILSMCIGFTLLSHLLRAARVFYGYKQHSKVLFPKVMGVSLVHNTLSFLLPMRIGEIALPLLSQQQLNIGLHYSSATLILIRLFDLHVLLSLLVFFTGSVWLTGPLQIIAQVCIIFCLPLMIYALKQLSTKKEKLAFIHPLVSDPLVWGNLYFLSFLLWLVKLFSFALLVTLLSTLSFEHAWLATIIADASALSPITGFANAGTFEAAFTLPLVPLGYNADQLIQVAVNLHLFIFIVNITAGIGGLMFLNKKATQETPLGN